MSAAPSSGSSSARRAVSPDASATARSRSRTAAGRSLRRARGGPPDSSHLDARSSAVPLAAVPQLREEAVRLFEVVADDLLELVPLPAALEPVRVALVQLGRVSFGGER